MRVHLWLSFSVHPRNSTRNLATQPALLAHVCARAAVRPRRQQRSNDVHVAVDGGGVQGLLAILVRGGEAAVWGQVVVHSRADGACGGGRDRVNSGFMCFYRYLRLGGPQVARPACRTATTMGSA